MFVLFYCPKGGVVVKQKSILLKTFFWLGFGYFPKGVRGGGVVDPNLKLLRHFLFLITRDTKGIFIGVQKHRKGLESRQFVQCPNGGRFPPPPMAPLTNFFAHKEE